MTLPADTRLNDTEPGGLLTAADFDHLTSRETAMLIGHDTEFRDTMPSLPVMDYRPIWYRGNVAACTSDACNQGRDSCPTPDACRLADNRDSSEQALATWLIGAGIIGAVVLILAAIFWRPL